MASKLLLPGFGGKYTATWNSISLNSIGSDTIDCSRCFTLALTLSSTSSGPASANVVQLQQSFDMIGWVNILTAVTAGTSAIFPHTAGPFGIVRIVASVAANSLITTLTGFPAQVNW